jgi:hypothetical protein
MSCSSRVVMIDVVVDFILMHVTFDPVDCIRCTFQTIYVLHLFLCVVIYCYP